MTKGKTLEIFVMGKEPRSLKKVELSNWNGIAFIGRRQHVEQVRTRPELNEPAIYMLLSDKRDGGGLTDIYIGEAEDFSNRLKQHIRDPEKDWFDQFIVFVAGHSLTKAHVKYLESELCKLANRSIGMLRPRNGNTPAGASLPESGIATMDEFLENIIFVLESLELSYFQENQSVITQLEEPKILENSLDGMEFQITLPRELSTNQNEFLKSYMIVRNGSYVLKAGSFVRKDPTDAFKDNSYELWKQIVNSDSVTTVDNNKVLKTTRDIEFNAPSGAGAIVRARATNGRVEWKRITDEKSLNDCEAE